MLLFVIICFLLIVFILSYLILWLIYRKAFKSKKKISKFLVFIGGIGLIIFYYTPYSYYLEPSFWQFRNMCKLDPEIYQHNGGKLDEEYYNKVLSYFDTSLDTMVKTIQPKQLVEFIDKSRHTLTSDDIKQIHKITKPIPNKFSYSLGKKSKSNGRIEYGSDIYVNIKNGDIKYERPAWFNVEWQTYRIDSIVWDFEVSGDFRMPTKILNCSYFKYKYGIKE
ncbi:hypothetical protein [Helicobacter sp. MIT 14-3879]|uniref:hypothetical protein n=1 Tax=Helicobacter sp. MIT 14-3879 TaxID=2040649 RepID=UPI0021618D07|nr:hypothetical protein [Helicobacter sp. MIT 14-3879]